MPAILATLPDDLQRAGRRLWQRTSEVTQDATDTLAASYKVLLQVCGNPQLLSEAENLLSSEVAAAIAEARQHIDRTYPAVSQSWQGSGAESFREYLPRLSGALKSIEDSAIHTAGALGLFTEGVESIYSTIVDRTKQTDDEVAATVSASRQAPHEAIGPVINIVEDYSSYVEELATTLMDLTSDSHAAGAVLARAAEVPHGLVSNAGDLQLPRPQADFSSHGFHPAHPQVSVDTTAMAHLTSSLSDNGNHWADAHDCSTRAADRLTPESFGLAGSHFCDDVHAVLDRDRQLYTTVNGHMDSLATGLRRATADYAAADDDIAAELRRYLDDES